MTKRWEVLGRRGSRRSLGRSFLSFEDNTVGNNTEADYNDEDDDTRTLYRTHSTFGVEGNVLKTEDARGNIAQENLFGMGGIPLMQTSVDAGPRWALSNIVGSPLRSYDTRAVEVTAGAHPNPSDPAHLRRFRSRYDTLQRPVELFIQVGPAAQSEPIPPS